MKLAFNYKIFFILENYIVFIILIHNKKNSMFILENIYNFYIIKSK